MTPASLFDAAGADTAPAIVLVHGSVVTRKMFLPQLGGLADTFHVIAPDLPGHGALAHRPFSFAAAVQVLADLITRETRGTALVAGVSLGGYLAMELAARHPRLVSGLVLSGSSVNFTGVLGVYLRTVAALMRRGWLAQSPAKVEKRTRRMFPAALSDVADAQVQAGLYPQSLGPAFAELAGRDFTAVLRDYPGPCLILNGERDRAARRGEAKFLAASRHGCVQHVAGAGHACNLDQPAAYDESIRAFAQAIASGLPLGG